MKVLYICNSDLGRHGNIGVRTNHVAKEAYRQGYLEKIICRGNSSDLPKEKIELVNFWYRPFNLVLSGISQFILKKFPSRNIQRWVFDFLVARKLRKENIKANILHIYEYAPLIIKEAKKQGMKVILDTQMAHGKTGDKIFGINRGHDIENKSAQLADKIICSSDFVIDSYIDAGVDKEKLVRIPYGVNLKKFSKGEKNKKFTCLFVGLVERRKGLEYFFKAWTELNLENSQLIICGRISKEGKELVNKYKKIKSIKFMGFTNPVPYYQSSHVFVFPSLFEGSGKVLYEAMAASLPIITTFNSGSPFKDGEAGFIVPIMDKESIKDKILELKDNKELQEKLGDMGKKIVQSYSWEQYGKNLINSYQNLF